MSQLFYVDRLVHFRRDVERVFPLLKGWTTEALRVRCREEFESDSLGHGFVDSRFNPAQTFKTVWDTVVQEEVRKIKISGEGCSKDNQMDPRAYTEKLVHTAKKVADSMSELMALIMDSPLYIRNDEKFNNFVQSAGALIGIKKPEDAATNEDPHGCTQKMLDEKWGTTPEWQDSIVRMMEVFEEKQQLEECLAGPSFSLGLSLDSQSKEEINKVS